MEQTIITLLIAAGGAVFGVLAIAGAYLAARAALRDANGALRKIPAPQPRSTALVRKPPAAQARSPSISTRSASSRR